MTEFNVKILREYPMQWALNREIIINDEYKINVNSYKLASNSIELCKLLRVNGKGVLNYTCLNYGDLEIALYFCHMETFLITEDNLPILFRVASIYGLLQLQKLCNKYVEEHLSFETCWKLWQAGRVYIDEDTNSPVEAFILKNFEQCTHFNGFYDLHEDELIELLKKDNLNVKNEYTLIEVLCRWVDSNAQERTCHIGKLISAVRLGRLTLEELEGLWKNSVIKRAQSDKCLKTVRQARRNYFRSKRNLRPLADVTCQNNPRVPHEAIFVFGGWESGQICQSVRIFNCRQNLWMSYTTPEEHSIVLPRPLMSFGIALLKNLYIYILGGEVRQQSATQEVIAFDLLKQKWNQRAPMHEIRRDLAVVNMNDEHIYAIGGDNNNSVLSNCERYSPVKNQWTEISPMMVTRSAPAADAFNNKLYVLGGYTEGNLEALTNSCEVYDPETNQWTFLKAMTQARYYFNAIAYQGHLYVLGGGDENHWSTVERYNPTDDIWEPMPGLLLQRADFAACVLEGEFVCLGGGGDSFCTQQVEKWKPGDRETAWETSVNLPVPIWGHRCVCVKGIDTILPYLKREYPATSSTTTLTTKGDSEFI